MTTEKHFASLRQVLGQYNRAMQELVWTMVNVRADDSLTAIEDDLREVKEAARDLLANVPLPTDPTQEDLDRIIRLDIASREGGGE